MALEAVMNYVVRPLLRNISYPFRCDSKVDTLRDQVEKLNNKRCRLQDSVDAATRNGEKIYDDVTKWLTTATKDIEDAEELIKGKTEAMNKCFGGICPNLKTRYQLSKKAHKKAVAVGKQLQDAQALPDPISSRQPPQPIVEPSVYSSEALPSRVLILNQIMGALKDPKLNMIGVYGMGGVGKTTLAKEVKGQAIQEKNLFETVVMVAVSQTPEVRRIQGEIADMLGLKFVAEEVPGRASQLHKRLEKAKVLIILDDVWQKLDLTAVGVPSGEGYEGCKIFLTSRRREVLCNEMRTQKDFSLDVLKEDETLILFQKSLSNVTDPELVTEIASKCAGLPLLILKVGADLRGKESYVWKDMSKRLSTLENSDIYEKVHKVIELSYENLLDAEAKSIFLLCALFGDSNIKIRKLLFYSVGLELFKDTYSIDEARNRVLALIDKLKDDCLLLDGDNDGFVKIHDVVRDVAVVIASRVQNAFVAAGKVRSTHLQNTDCTRISLPYCNIPELPGVLECPKAEVFSLFGGGGCSLPDIPSSFFEGVPKLKVVDISGVGFESGLPSSLGCLTGLQTLCLQRCGLDNLAVVAELKQLEVLSFAGSNIAELPGEIKGLTRLKILDLSYCFMLKVIPADVLSNLSSLEELYMLDSFPRWEAEGNASLEELKNLSHLTTLEIKVDDDKLLPDDWIFNGVLQNYRIYIGEYWKHYRVFNEILTSRRILKLQLESSSIGLMRKIKEFVRGTEDLELREAKGVENMLDDCGSFEKLQILEIYDCDTLKSLSSHSTGMVSFPKLATLIIYKCNGLKYVFTNSMVKSLEQLEKLEIEECESLEEIILTEEIEEESINMMVFPKLDSLRLENLKELKRFSSGHPIDLLVCPTVEKNLVSKFTNRSNNNERVDEYFFNEMVSFPKLTTLVIHRCHGLKYVFTNSMVKSIEQLEKLEIKECESLEEIILSEEIEEESINRMVFPKLDFLKLENLKQLKMFSSGHPIDFPLLRELRIAGCGAIEKNLVSKFMNRNNNNERADEYFFNEMIHFPNLELIHIQGIDSKYVFHKSVACNLLQLRELKIIGCSVEMITWNAEEESIKIEWPNLTRLKVLYCHKLIKFGSNNSKVSFTSLTKLRISDCKGLEYIFTSSMACGLLQLRKLKIIECGVEVIIGNVEEETIEIKWPNLTHLEVLKCEKLIKFGSNNSKLFLKVEVLKLDDHCFKAIKSDGLPVDWSLKLKEVSLMRLSVNGSTSDSLFGFLRRINSLGRLIFDNCCLELDCILSVDDVQKIHPTLEYLELTGVSDLKHILKKESQFNPFLQHLQSLVVESCDDLMNIAPSAASFQNLTTLQVSHCEKMTSLVTASTAKTMVQLMELIVSDCEMMDEIVARDDMVGCTENDGITFKNLKLLGLGGLDRLSSFCSGNYQFNFPLLEKVVVNDCSRMMTFCSGILNTPKLHRIKLDDYQEEQWEGDLNDIIGSQATQWVGEPILPNKMQLFRRLKKLIVRDCNWVEVVFDLEGAHVGLLPELSELKLINLPKLTQLCNSDPRDILDFNKLRKLKIENCSRLEYALTTSMSLCFSQLHSIKVKNCERMKTIIMEEDAITNSGTDLQYCPSVEMLTILNCPSIKAFILRRTMNDLDIHLSSKAFPNLEELILDMKSIKAILQFELPPNFFCKVKKLGIRNVSRSTMKMHVRLFHFLSMAFNLDSLWVDHSSVEVLKFQELNIKFREEAMTTLSRIRELKLHNFDELKQIWWQNSDELRYFESLEILKVVFCGQITSIASSPASFQNLRELGVYWCNQLRYLMTSSVAKSMVQLETLTVQSCKMLAEVVSDQNDGTTDEIVFTKLKRLDLYALPSLTSFSSKHCAFQFPCLVEVFIRVCPNLGFFCPGTALAPNLDYIVGDYFRHCRDLLSRRLFLNTIIQYIHKNLLDVVQVEDVKLSMFPILKEKWAAQFPFEKLRKLKRLEVDDCAEFTMAISSHLLPHLSKF